MDRILPPDVETMRQLSRHEFLSRHGKLLLDLMLRAREGDRREGILFRQGVGWFQLPGSGHEALAVISSLLEPDDLVFPHYRDRALMLAKGVSNYEVALGYLGKAGSSSGGRQMSSHFSSKRLNVVSCASPTGIQCLPAAGSAWAHVLARKSSVSICFLGDAATRQGEFFEAICFATEHSLPVVFVVEDNGIGISSYTQERNPLSLGVLSGGNVVRGNGRDTFEVFSIASEAVSKARSGGGPTVVWLDMDRLSSHASSDDQRVYRPELEITAMEARDPLSALAAELIERRLLTDGELESMQSQIAFDVGSDYRTAREAEDPAPWSWRYHVLSDEVPRESRTQARSAPFSTMAEAVNETLKDLLSGNSRTLVFGEDVEDPKGGVFGLTRGLSTLFPGRVVNSPLAEASIVGLGAGLAIAGMRPIFELQFIDFVGPGLHQLINQVATLRWRSNGEWSCPLVLLAPCGGYLPGGGPWHSQSGEAILSQIPGIRVLMPSCAADAAAMLRSAVEGEDPVVILLPKHQFYKKVEPRTDPTLEFGKARVVRTGVHVTLLAWGNCVSLSLQAAEDVAFRGISVEVIDLVSLSPYDWAAVVESLSQTGRLVVVQEESRQCSIGQSLIAEAVSHPETWFMFRSGPLLVSKEHVLVAFNPAVEADCLPSVPDIVSALVQVMEH